LKTSKKILLLRRNKWVTLNFWYHDQYCTLLAAEKSFRRGNECSI